MRILHASLIAAGFFGFLGPAVAQAQTGPSAGLSLMPALVRNDEVSVVPGLELEAFVEHLRHNPTVSFSRSFYFSGRGHGSFVRDPALNPDHHRLYIGAGGSVSLRRLRTIDLNEDIDTIRGPFVFNLGVVGLGLTAALEASQDWNEQSATAGIELRYTHDAFWWMPSALISAAWVAPLQSTARDRLNLKLEGHGRGEIGLYWFIPLSAEGGMWALVVDAHAFQAWGMNDQVAGIGFDQGLFGSASIVYRIAHSFGPVRLDEVVVRWSGGHLPTMTEEREALEIGLRFGLSP